MTVKKKQGHSRQRFDRLVERMLLIGEKYISVKDL